MTDSKIIELFLGRSDKAVPALAESYGGYCFRVAYNILMNRQDSEECVNDTYFKVWNVIPPQNPINFQGFLGKIVRNLALNRVRLFSTKKRGGGQYEAVFSELSEILPSEERVERHIESKEAAKAINAFAASLDNESRTVFLLRYFSFYSIGDIAKKIGRNENRVQYLLRKLRNNLKEYLEKEELL